MSLPLPSRRSAIVAVLGAAGIALAAWGAIRLLERRASSESASTLRQTVQAADDRLTIALARARSSAAVLAASPQVDAALLGRGAVPSAELRAHPDAALFDRLGERLGGTAKRYAIHGDAQIVVSGKKVGRVVVGVPLAEIEAAANPPYAVSLVSRAIAIPAGRAVTFRLAGTRVRARRLAVGGGISLLASVPSADVGASRRSKELLLAAAFAAWAALALLLPSRRSRSDQVGASLETLRLFGEALAASHAPRTLLSAFLRIAVEVTGARGGTLIENGRVIERTGTIAGRRLEIPIRIGGTIGPWSLTLAAPREGFDPVAVERAEELALQVSAALTNAHLHELVQEQSQTDELTSLANRRRFVDRLSVEVDRASQSGTPLSLIAADLDNFKLINDEFGHQGGDLTLRHFAGLIGLYTREIDISARVGGDEFMVLLPQTGAAGAATLARRIRTAAASARLAARDGRTFTVTASLGVAVLQPGQAVDDFIERADAALYAAKANGRNTVVVADS